MKKRLIFIFLFVVLLTNLITLSLITAQTAPALPGLSGEMDSATGLPAEYSEFRNNAESLSEEEKRNEYMDQEWTKLLANKKVVGPVLFYTNKFFTIFNPFWKIVFGIEFSWSWAFFFSLGVFILLVRLIYDPLTSFFNFGTLPKTLVTLAVVTLIGVSGGIKIAVDLISNMISGWLGIVMAFLIGVIIGVIYHMIMKKFSKKYKKDEKKLREEAEERRAKKGEAIEEIQNAQLGN